MRPAGKARRPRIPGVFERGATQPGGMQRRTNAAVFTRRTTKAYTVCCFCSQWATNMNRSANNRCIIRRIASGIPRDWTMTASAGILASILNRFALAHPGPPWTLNGST
jgi:hypothetical protein